MLRGEDATGGRDRPTSPSHSLPLCAIGATRFRSRASWERGGKAVGGMTAFPLDGEGTPISGRRGTTRLTGSRPGAQDKGFTRVGIHEPSVQTQKLIAGNRGLAGGTIMTPSAKASAPALRFSRMRALCERPARPRSMQLGLLQADNRRAIGVAIDPQKIDKSRKHCDATIPWRCMPCVACSHSLCAPNRRRYQLRSSGSNDPASMAGRLGHLRPTSAQHVFVSLSAIAAEASIGDGACTC